MPGRVYERSLDGRTEAHLIALACSEPPEGRARWSIRLLADKAVELGIVPSVSHETVRKTLKNELKPHLIKGWVIPKKRVQFVWRMKAVLDLYEKPYDPLLPVVCFDGRPWQLLAEVRAPLPTVPGAPERRDHEYERRGMAHVSMTFEPLTGWRRTVVSERRRKQEFAEAARYLAEEAYPDTERIRLVFDNLSTHTATAFYEIFVPELARRLTKKIEFCYTPVHGSWVNMVGVELSVMVRQCLWGRRLADAEALGQEVGAWEAERTRLGASVEWRFAAADARTKLRKLYLSIEV
jgi:hypothetical protein